MNSPPMRAMKFCRRFSGSTVSSNICFSCPSNGRPSRPVSRMISMIPQVRIRRLQGYSGSIRGIGRDRRQTTAGPWHKGCLFFLYSGTFPVIGRSGVRLLVAALFFKYLDQYLTLLSILGSFRAGRNKLLASDISVIYHDSSFSNQRLLGAGLPPIVQAECL